MGETQSLTGVVAALIYAWLGVLVVVAIDIASTARRVSRSGLILAVALMLGGAACTKEKIVYRDNPAGPSEPVEPVVSATPQSLKFPQGIPDHDIIVIPGQPTEGIVNAVNNAIHEVLPDCTVGDVHCDGHGYDAQSFFYVLNTKLRAKGLWAGQHHDGETDEITVGTSCTGEWQNFHAWSYGDVAPLWAKVISEPCAGEACRGRGTSYRGNTVIDAKYCK